MAPHAVVRAERRPTSSRLVPAMDARRRSSARGSVGEPFQLYVRALDSAGAARSIASVPGRGEIAAVGAVDERRQDSCTGTRPGSGPCRPSVPRPSPLRTSTSIALSAYGPGKSADITPDGSTLATIGRTLTTGRSGFGRRQLPRREVRAVRARAVCSAGHPQPTRGCGFRPTAGSCCCSGTPAPDVARKCGSCRSRRTRTVRRDAFSSACRSRCRHGSSRGCRTIATSSLPPERRRARGAGSTSPTPSRAPSVSSRSGPADQTLPARLTGRGAARVHGAQRGLRHRDRRFAARPP